MKSKKVRAHVSQSLTALLMSTAFAAAGAQAGTVYENALFAVAGDCSFSTTCAAELGRDGDFAAQQFSLSSGATIKSASFSIFDVGSMPTGANWQILLSDGAGGLPGTVVASGSNAIAAQQNLGSAFGYYSLDKVSFNTGSVSLSAGNYYFAVQAVSPVFETYLSQGVADSGAAEYLGGSWRGNYGDGVISSVAVGLYDTQVAAVPEPESYAMLLAGLGVMGWLARRRKLA